MTPRRLLLVLALALPAMLLATLPLRLALELPGIAHWGLAARSASGSIWNGRLEGASVRDMALGDASVRLSPLPLLLGTTAARLSAPGVDARLLHGRRRGVDRLEGRLTLPPSSLAAGIPLQLQASSLQVLFSDDACHAASGRVTLVAGKADGPPLAVLEGAASCEGRTAVLPLAAVSGEGPLARLQASVRIHPDGQWDIEAQAPVVDDPALGIALEAAGFQPGPGGWSRAERGRLE